MTLPVHATNLRPGGHRRGVQAVVESGGGVVRAAYEPFGRTRCRQDGKGGWGRRVVGVVEIDVDGVRFRRLTHWRRSQCSRLIRAVSQRPSPFRPARPTHPASACHSTPIAAARRSLDHGEHASKQELAAPSRSAARSLCLRRSAEAANSAAHGSKSAGLMAQCHPGTDCPAGPTHA